MANRYAVANGNWSNPATWDGGTLPASGDVVRANGFSVTIDQDVTVATLRNNASAPAVAAGFFFINGGVTVTANVLSDANGNANWIVCINGDQTIVGNINANSNAGWTVFKSTTGTVTIVGNVTAGPSNTAHGLRLDGPASAVVVGNVRGMNSTFSNAHGIWINSGSTGSVMITGNVQGLNASGGSGVFHDGIGPLTINGNAIGGTANNGHGLTCTAASVVTINGDAIANAVEAVVITGATLLTITGAVVASTGAPGVFCTNRSARLIVNDDLTASATGVFPLGRGVVLIDAAATISHTYRVNNSFVAGVARSLYTGGVNLGQPVPADVRFGTEFGVSNEYTGTLRVPAPEFVNAGVLTDDTVGTLSVDLQPILDAIQAIDVDFGPVLDRLPESGRAATAEEVSPTIDFQPTIDFSPTIEPTPITVNPTVLSPESIAEIRDGLAIAAGVYQIAIIAKRSTDGAGVAGVRFGIDGTEQTATTDVLGRAFLYVDADGVYEINAITPAGYLSPGVISVEVDGANVEVDVELVPVTLPPPTVAGACTVAVDVVTQYVANPTGAHVVAAMTSPPAAGGALVVFDPAPVATVDGRALLTLHRGKQYRLAVTFEGQTRNVSVAVPDAPAHVVVVNL
jgi:hypothetical protein